MYFYILLFTFPPLFPSWSPCCNHHPMVFLHTAARMKLWKPRKAHVTPWLETSEWLPIPLRTVMWDPYGGRSPTWYGLSASSHHPSQAHHCHSVTALAVHAAGTFFSHMIFLPSSPTLVHDSAFPSLYDRFLDYKSSHYMSAYPTLFLSIAMTAPEELYFAIYNVLPCIMCTHVFDPNIQEKSI